MLDSLAYNLSAGVEAPELYGTFVKLEQGGKKWLMRQLTTGMFSNTCPLVCGNIKRLDSESWEGSCGKCEEYEMSQNTTGTLL